MNKEQLVSLISKLYPTDMKKQAEISKKDDIENTWIKPTKKYLETPAFEQMFEFHLGQMGDTQLSLETPEHELNFWKHYALGKDKKDYASVKSGHTYLDTKFYTPEYFAKKFAFDYRNIKEIKEFTHNKLANNQQLYYTYRDDFSNETHRVPLTKAMVIKSVKHGIKKYQKTGVEI